MREDDSVLEKKIVPLCYPYQIKGVVPAVTKMEVRRLDDKYQETEPPQVAEIRVLTREAVAELLELNGQDTQHFLLNTQYLQAEQRFVVDLKSLVVHPLADQD